LKLVDYGFVCFFHDTNFSSAHREVIVIGSKLDIVRKDNAPIGELTEAITYNIGDSLVCMANYVNQDSKVEAISRNYETDEAVIFIINQALVFAEQNRENDAANVKKL
jgi:hypothetical protein